MTKIEEIREAVAVELERQMEQHPELYFRRSDWMTDGRIDFDALIRAIVAAMREPTEAMVQAGIASLDDGATYQADLARITHRHMIDAALKE